MQLKVGEIVEGTVRSLTKFGAFVTLEDGSSGLVHISEIAHAYVTDVGAYLSEGQRVRVMVIGLENGKINLSIKRTQEQPARPAFSKPRQDRPRPAGQGRAPGAQQSAPQQKSFDDMLKQFMSESDSKMSSIRQYSDHRTKTRKR